MNDEEEFFEIIDSHPMTDNEASERFSKCNPRLLPLYEQWNTAAAKLHSEYWAWSKDYDEYLDTFLKLADDLGMPYEKKWTADTRKRLVDLEKYFLEIATVWS